ncbi:MAG: M15 family metallopeptidase [Ruminococcus sp.]|nr:M15 family metallopeptidase [Ruminococcus sp.]
MKRKNKVLIMIILILAGMVALKLTQSEEIPDDWRLILVNDKHSVPKNYEPELTQLSNGIYIDSRIYPDLQQMFDDARRDGIYPVVSEGYRTREQQKKMMQEKTDSFINEGYSAKEAEKLAEKWVAEAGKSEHELGIALDINADPSYSSDEEVYNWLAGNAFKYGFILRYPQNKENITGIDYEPWHYRYVGKDTALKIYSQQITLEEYLS